MRLVKLCLISFVLALSHLPDLAFGQTKVATREELARALQTAKGGERFALSPGNYGDLVLRGRQNRVMAFSRPVEIVSADASQPAVFSSLDLAHVSGVIFRQVAFRYVYGRGDPTNLAPFSIRDCSDITFLDASFTGDTARDTGSTSDGYATARGLTVFQCRSVRVENSKFTTWHRAGVFGHVDGLIVRGNEVSAARSDGFNFAQVTDAVIERNHIHSFRINLATGDHPDMIQFWTNGTKSPSARVVIRDNILDVAGGNTTQTIFIRNEEVDKGRAGREMLYKDFTITGNLIRNNHVHGITMGEVDGLVITNNTLLQATTPPRHMHVTVPAINVKPTATNVTITNNVSPRLPVPSPDWTMSNNIRIQRNFPRDKDFYGSVFVNALAPGAVPLAELQLLPDLSGQQPPIGSALSRFDDRPAEPRLILSSRPASPGPGALQNLDIKAAYGPSGKIDLTGAMAIWDLGGGETKPGLSISHRFAASGLVSARVVVTLAGGRRIEGARTIQVE
jgi:hypothetical protein